MQRIGGVSVMTADLAQRLREHANGGQNCSHVNAPLLREAADALDKAESYGQQMRDDRDASTETYVKAKQRIKELEAERDTEHNAYVLWKIAAENVNAETSKLEARLAAAEAVVEAAREVRRKHPGNGETADLVLDKELAAYDSQNLNVGATRLNDDTGAPYKGNSYPGPLLNAQNLNFSERKEGE